MGPLIFISGNARRVRGFRRGPRASMGPLIFISGNREQVLPIPPDHNASMGPLIFISGNSEFSAIHLARIGLQWGR